MNCKKMGLKIGLFVLVGVAVMAAVVMGLWNWLMPALFLGAVSQISYVQAVGILILSKILFGCFRGRGGFHRHGGHGHGTRPHWAKMTDEERSQFREKMRARCAERKGQGPQQS